ncbi:MAG: biotin/lipoyl-binding protein [Brevinematales bacterium]|nr:biotin/lipoyl-binding protein [Brevinematales bacterium]
MVEEIKKVVEIAKNSGIKELYVKLKDTKLSIKFSGDSHSVDVGSISYSLQHQEFEETTEQEIEDVKSLEVKSTFVGIFRLNDKKGNPIVSVGKSVSKGDLLCNIEVLGVLNEIKSPVNGVITKIFLKDGDIVGYGDTIIEIKPNE